MSVRRDKKIVTTYFILVSFTVSFKFEIVMETENIKLLKDHWGGDEFKHKGERKSDRTTCTEDHIR